VLASPMSDAPPVTGRSYLLIASPCFLSSKYGFDDDLK
jgi:hypothetical protein